MDFLLYAPFIGLITIGIIIPTILFCCCKNCKNCENNENNENIKLLETNNDFNPQNVLKIYDPLLL